MTPQQVAQPENNGFPPLPVKEAPGPTVVHSESLPTDNEAATNESPFAFVINWAKGLLNMGGPGSSSQENPVVQDEPQFVSPTEISTSLGSVSGDSSADTSIGGVNTVNTQSEQPQSNSATPAPQTETTSTLPSLDTTPASSDPTKAEPAWSPVPPTASVAEISPSVPSSETSTQLGGQQNSTAPQEVAASPTTPTAPSRPELPS